MKKIHMIAALLAMFAPMTQVWAVPDSHSTHYGKIAVEVATGEGTVYVSTSSTATSGQTSDTWNCEGDSSEDSKTWYIYAKSNSEDWEFKGWSTSKTGTPDGNTTSPVSKSVSTTSTKSGSPSTTTYYAHFASTLRDPFDITFAPGNYTVDGVAVGSINADNYKGLRKVKTVALSSSDENFLNWLINNESVANASHTLTCESDTTVEAVFLAADQVTTVTTIADLTSALSNAQYKKVTIPSGTTIQIPKGTTVTVPSGKQLVMDGTLIVLGTLSNSGAISGNGTLYKISYLIDQGDVITIKTAYGTECEHLNFAADAHYNKMPRYCKTTVTKHTPTIRGTVGLPANQQSWGVLLNGKNAYAITTQNPAGVTVSFDTTTENGYQKTVNKITGVTGTVTSTSLSATGNYVLFSDCTLTGPLESKKLANQSVIDCAGRQIKATTNTHYKFCTLCLNGTVYFSASQWQNAKAAFFNCTSIEIYGIKGESPSYAFYDCGTVESPASVKFSYYKTDYSTTSDASSTNHKTAYFYSGFYEYGFNDTNDGSSYSYVYGGSFKTKPIGVPTKPDSNGVEIEATSPEDNGTKYWVVQKKGAVQNVVSIGDTPYQSLALAIDAAQDSGSVITLIDNVRIENESVVVPPAKNITISLNGYAIIGGKIVNNGTLLLTDKETGNCNTVMSLSGGTVSSEIENNGTLGIAWGTYSGAIANKVGGTLTVHNGRFEGSIDNSGGSVVLKGGHFKKSVYSEASLATLGVGENCKIFTAVEQVSVDCFSIFEEPNGDMVYSNGAYSITPYKDGDYNLLKDWTKDSKNSYADYSSNVNNWTRLAELLSFYQVFNGKIIDVALVADRRIAANTLGCTGVLNNSLNYPLTIEHQIDVGMTNYVLSAAVVEKGYTAIAYKYIFTHQVGAIKTIGLKTEVTGNGGSANNGTVCVALINFWNSTRASDYHAPDNMHMLTNSLYVAAKQRFTIGADNNVAMIRPETGAATFYETLGAALEAVEDGGTVMLANDCDNNVTVGKACTIDTNGFKFTGEIKPGDRYSISVADGVYVVKIPDPVEQVNVENVVSEVISTEWLEANNIETDASPEDIQAEVLEKLNEEDTNGNAKWENLVIGQDPEEHAAITAVNGGTPTNVNVDVSFDVPKDEAGTTIDTGYTVGYAFDKADARGNVTNVTDVVAETPTLDLTEVSTNAPSYFKMRAVLESTDGSVSTNVPVEKTIGVLRVDSDAEYTIIAVPWKSLDSGDIKASELVHAASLQKGDALYAYDNEGNLKSWVVDNGVWTSPNEVSVGGGGQTDVDETDPAKFGIARGQGVWLKRSDPTNSPIYMVGQPATNAVETVLKPAAANGEASWNLVASPKLEAVNIATRFTDNTDDEIVVPTAGTPKNYTYKEGAWGYPKTEVMTDKVFLPGKGWVYKIRTFHCTTDVEIPAGTGFWYLNKQGEPKTIVW